MNNKPNFHLERVNSDILKCVSNTLLYKVKNPHVASASVVKAETLPGYYETKIFVSVLDKSEEDLVLSALKECTPFVRREVAASVKLRKTPQIKFVIDHGNENYDKISELLKQIEDERNNRSN